MNDGCLGYLFITFVILLGMLVVMQIVGAVLG